MGKIYSDKHKAMKEQFHYIYVFEPRLDKTCLREFPTRPDTNRPCAATEAS